MGESVEQPADYYVNNVAEGISLLGGLLDAQVERVVFSSSCATYGEPEQVPIPETHRQWPVNPYGWSKFFMERILESYDHAYGLKFVAPALFQRLGLHAEQGRGPYARVASDSQYPLRRDGQTALRAGARQ